MSAFETIILEKRGPIAWVTLNRPRVLNVYNVRMRDEVYEALGLIADDPGTRVAVFRGAGDRAFCAGADLTEFGTAPSQAIARQVRFERDVWGRFLGLGKLIIAAIHGFCFGSGIEIALCCDIRIASPGAQFGLPETSLGMIPAAGGTQTMPRIIGAAWGMESLLTGQRFGAEEALRLGLVTRLEPQDRIFDAASEIADELARRDPVVLRLAKEAVNRGLDGPLSRGLEVEERLALQLLAG